MDPGNEHTSNAEFSFPEDGGRPIVNGGTAGPMFRPNDQVMLRLPGNEAQGPYTVSSVTDEGRYKLCDEHGNEVNGGQLFGEKDLRLYEVSF